MTSLFFGFLTSITNTRANQSKVNLERPQLAQILVVDLLLLDVGASRCLELLDVWREVEEPRLQIIDLDFCLRVWTSMGGFMPP